MKKILLFLMIIFTSISIHGQVYNYRDEYIVKEYGFTKLKRYNLKINMVDSTYSFKYAPGGETFITLPLNNVVWIKDFYGIIYSNKELMDLDLKRQKSDIDRIATAIESFESDFHILYLIQISTIALALLLILIK